MPIEADQHPLQTDRPLAIETKLYYDLYAPARTPAPLLIALHGYGSNKGWMLRAARQLAHTFANELERTFGLS